MKYQAVYKCRLCGKNACEKRRFTFEETMAKAMADSSNMGMPIISFHVCDDKSLGITDFQGFKAVKDGEQTN